MQALARILISSFFLLFGMLNALAAPNLYSDEGSFETAQSNARIGLEVEGFNQAGLTGTEIVFDEMTVTSPVSVQTTTNAFGVVPSEGTHTLWSQNLTFTFAEPINAFSIDITDFGDAASCDSAGSDYPCTLSVSVDGGPATGAEEFYQTALSYKKRSTISC